MGAPRTHRELDVYRRGMAAILEIIQLSRRFPEEEKWELIKQIRASSRSVCSCVAEAWRKRNYPAAFASKLTEAESEAAETQFWIELAHLHDYITIEDRDRIIARYEVILGQLVNLRRSAVKWKRP